MDEANRRETADDDEARHRFARAMWLGPRDCVTLFRAAVDHSIVGRDAESRGSAD